MSDYNLPDDRRYTANHIWIKKDGEVYRAGITDYAQAQLGQIVYVNLPRPEDQFAADDEFGTIESVKTVSPLLMPVAGKIRAVNLAIENDPGLVNNDCYGKGWIVEIVPDDKEAVDRLPDAATYRKLI